MQHGVRAISGIVAGLAGVLSWSLQIFLALAMPTDSAVKGRILVAVAILASIAIAGVIIFALTELQHARLEDREKAFTVIHLGERVATKATSIFGTFVADCGVMERERAQAGASLRLEELRPDALAFLEGCERRGMRLDAAVFSTMQDTVIFSIDDVQALRVEARRLLKELRKSIQPKGPKARRVA